MLSILGMPHNEFTILAIPVLVTSSWILMWLTRAHTRDVGGKTWAARLPVFVFQKSDIDPSSAGGRLYQGWVLFGALILPILASIYLYCKFLEPGVYLEVSRAVCVATPSDCKPERDCKEMTNDCWIDTPLRGVKHLSLYGRWEAPKSAGIYRYGSTTGPEYFRWEPWAYFAVIVILLVYGVRTLNLLFRQSTSRTKVAQSVKIARPNDGDKTDTI